MLKPRRRQVEAVTVVAQRKPPAQSLTTPAMSSLPLGMARSSYPVSSPSSSTFLASTRLAFAVYAKPAAQRVCIAEGVYARERV